MTDCKECNKSNDKYCSYWKEEMKFHMLQMCTGYEKRLEAPQKAVLSNKKFIHELSIINIPRPANVDAILQTPLDDIYAGVKTKCLICSTSVTWSAMSPTGKCDNGHTVGRTDLE